MKDIIGINFYFIKQYKIIEKGDIMRYYDIRGET